MRVTLLGMVWFVLLWSACVAQAPTQSISVAGNARQGNPIFVTVNGVAPGATGELRWNNIRWPLSPADDKGRMRTVAAISVDMPNGSRPMIVELADGTQLQTAVNVSARWFPEQHLWIDPNTLANYDNPQNKADDDAIIDKLKVFDAVQHWHGNFRLPIHARESTGFGFRRTYNGWKHSYHKGLDLAGEQGTPVHATADGVVVHVATGIVNGNTVAIMHGLGIGSVYLHMKDINVHEGQIVKAGDVVGHVGGTGGFAPHLHWEIRINGVAVDPHSLEAIPDGWR